MLSLPTVLLLCTSPPPSLLVSSLPITSGRIMDAGRPRIIQVPFSLRHLIEVRFRLPPPIFFSAATGSKRHSIAWRESGGNGCMDTLDESEDGRTRRNACLPACRLGYSLLSLSFPPARRSAGARTHRHLSSLHFPNLGSGGAIPCQVFPDGAGG